MTYASLLEAYGWERFETDARAAGATSFIIVDTAAGSRPELRAGPARRPHLDRRAHRARRLGDRRLALPRHAHRHDRRPHRALGRARRPRRPRAGADRRAALRRLRHLDARSRHAPQPTSRTASSSARGRCSWPRRGRRRCRSTWRRCGQRARRRERRLLRLHALAAALAALEALGEEEPLRLRHLVAEDPAAQAHASGPILTSIFPMFSPLSRPSSASGACSSPSTTVSR